MIRLAEFPLASFSLPKRLELTHVLVYHKALAHMVTGMFSEE